MKMIAKSALKPIVLLLSIFIQFTTVCKSASYELFPNYHTIGISIRSTTPLAFGLVTQTFVSEKTNNQWSAYKPGFELCRVTSLYYAGCIFNTKPGTWYKIRSVIKSGATVVLDLTDSVYTRQNPIQVNALRQFYVAPNGSGISQNKQSPGALNQNLLDNLKAGDKVILLPGRYFVGELKLNKSGTEQAPIVIAGENTGVILDGSIGTPITWTRVTSDVLSKDYNMFAANLGSINTNCIVNNEKRLYPYRNVQELSLFSSIRGVDGSGNAFGIFKINEDGFFRDGRDPSVNHFPYTGHENRTFIKFADGTDTSGKNLHVSKNTHAFLLNNQNHVVFRNLTFQYYGAAKLNNYRCALLLENCDRIWVDSCVFQFCDRGIVCKGNSDQNTVEHSSFEDDFAKLSYFQFKETGLDYGQLNSNFPNFFPNQYRNIEPGRIYFDFGFTGRGNVIRNNYFQGGCDGITCPPISSDSNTGRHFDIYNNEFGSGSDDAFEVDGNASNIRVWGNVMHGAANGISVASPCVGPVYIFRNTMYDFRKTIYEYVVNFTTLISDTIAASPLKLNAAYCDLPGTVYFLHNTISAGKESYGLVLFQPQAKSSWAKVIAKNNLFYVNSPYYTLWVRALDSVDLNYNNYYNAQGFKARQDRPGFAEYNSFNSARSSILGNINDPNSSIEKNGYHFNPAPGWIDPGVFNFHLKQEANAIDKAVVLTGINDDYTGNNPDLGAFEYEPTSAHIGFREAGKEMLVYPNPAQTEIHFQIPNNRFESVLIQIYNAQGQLITRQFQNHNSLVMDISKLAQGLYYVQCLTETDLYNSSFIRK